MRAIHVIVEGEVQGVGFRYSAMREANSLGLVGWVRNAEDGSVEVWAEGEEDSLEEFSRWLGRGPAYATVHRTLVSWEKPLHLYSSFSIAF